MRRSYLPFILLIVATLPLIAVQVEEVETYVGLPLKFWAEITVSETTVAEFRLLVEGNIVNSTTVTVMAGAPHREEFVLYFNEAGDFHVRIEVWLTEYQTLYYHKEWIVHVRPWPSPTRTLPPTTTPPPQSPTSPQPPTMTPSPYKPDLVPVWLRIEDAVGEIIVFAVRSEEGSISKRVDKPLKVGDTYNVEIAVMNVGEGDAGSFEVQLNAEAPFSNVFRHVVQGLSPEQNATIVSGSWTVTQRHIRVSVMVDAVYQVEETDEQNNNLIVEVKIVEYEPLPDLDIAGVTVDRTTAEPGENVELTITVSNVGERDSSQFTVRVYDGLPQASDPEERCIKKLTVEGIPVGGSTTMKTTVQIPDDAGELFSFYVYIDIEDKIEEYDDQNNNFDKSPTIRVSSPEPTQHPKGETWRKAWYKDKVITIVLPLIGTMAAIAGGAAVAGKLRKKKGTP